MDSGWSPANLLRSGLSQNNSFVAIGSSTGGVFLRSSLVGIYCVRRRRHRHIPAVTRSEGVKDFRNRSHRVDRFASADFGME